MFTEENPDELHELIQPSAYLNSNVSNSSKKDNLMSLTLLESTMLISLFIFSSSANLDVKSFTKACEEVSKAFCHS